MEFLPNQTQILSEFRKSKANLVDIFKLAISYSDESDVLYSDTSDNLENCINEMFANSEIVLAFRVAGKPKSVIWSSSLQPSYVQNGEVTPVKPDVREGGFRQTEVITAKCIGLAFDQINKQNPIYLGYVAKKRREKEAASAQAQHNNSMPLLKGGLYDCLHQMVNYATCFENFKQLISYDPLDRRDRNHTRICRAFLVHNDQHHGELDGGDISVYRAQPAGCEIEPGDWVTLSEDKAAAYLEHFYLSGIIDDDDPDESNAPYVEELCVSASDVFSYDGSEDKLIYCPKPVFIESLSSALDIWNQYNQNKKPMTFLELEDDPANSAS